MFLTDQEIVTLTGYRRASKQIEQLKAQRIPFHVTAAGKPRVTQRAVEGGSKAQRTEIEPRAPWSPSWANITKAV